MPENIRALIVILALAVPAFYTGRQIASSINTDREFTVWRNIWLAVIVVAFLSVDFFVYVVMLIAVCLYARSVRAASVGLFFILLFVVPSGTVLIGGMGIVNQLLSISNPRLLSIFLLLPLLFTARGFDPRQLANSAMPDRLIVAYVLVSTALQYRSSDATVTGLLREGTTYALDALIPYFAFSRTVTSVADVRKVFFAFVVAAFPLSFIAVFEVIKYWHLYYVLGTDWGYETQLWYLERNGLLRATGPAIGSIVLGFVIMVAVGCMLGIWQSIRTSPAKRIGLAILAAGLSAPLARGPWVGTAVLLLVYLATGPNSTGNFGKLAVIGSGVIALLLFIPGSTRLIDFLPFVGTVDVGSVDYRQQLFDHAMVVIQRYPLFGTPNYRQEPEMLEMMQGQHIIDIVNTYLEIALKSGLVGLTLFVGFFVSILMRLRRMLKFHAAEGPNFNSCVRASIAILIAILVTIGTVSSMDFIPYVYWSFAGLSVALIRIGYRERAAVAHVAEATQLAA